MRLSCKGRYALRAIFDLASHTPGTPVPVGGIARRQRIPHKFLELVLSSLKQEGFVNSRRGVQGGYYLTREAAAITVGQVLRAMEKGRTGARQPEGPFSGLWQQVDRKIWGIVDDTDFESIVRQWAETARESVPNWDI